MRKKDLLSFLLVLFCSFQKLDKKCKFVQDSMYQNCFVNEQQPNTNGDLNYLNLDTNGDLNYLNLDISSYVTGLSSNQKNYFESRKEEIKEYKEITSFLSNFRGFGNLGNHFGIIALSNAAEGLAKLILDGSIEKEEGKFFLDKITNIAFGISSYKNFDYPEKENALYLSHLNIILGIRELICKDKKYFPLNKKISEYLARKTLSDPQKHIRSFKNKKFKWPADQTATLYSLWLFDKNHHANLSRKPIEEWLNWMEENGKDKNTGLHYSEITGSTKYSRYPRGCALSFSIYYMSFFAPGEAKKLWEDYKKHYGVDLHFFYGFREWPKGAKKEVAKWDKDSGPILFGVGSAATVLAKKAALSVGDKKVFLKLSNTLRISIEIFKKIFEDESFNFLINSLLLNSSNYILDWEK
ncbi:MAG: hypothetical protein QXL88_00810 [Candidatus Pacearchaeota archaeon]